MAHREWRCILAVAAENLLLYAKLSGLYPATREAGLDRPTRRGRSSRPHSNCSAQSAR